MTIDTVELTYNEVKHGKDCGFVDLIVVDEIELITDEATGKDREKAAVAGCGKTGHRPTTRSRFLITSTSCHQTPSHAD